MDIVSAKLFTVIFLLHGQSVLMLRRAPWKTFAPNRWTGLGVRVEPHELENLGLSARRELFEETDLQPSEVSDLVLRRTLTFFSEDDGLVTLLYFTGDAATLRVPTCTEGDLAWIDRVALESLDVIENTALVGGFVLDDVDQGADEIQCGVAVRDFQGRLVDVRFD
jgi:8-oxo-dGTP diphosphatase